MEAVWYRARAAIASARLTISESGRPKPRIGRDVTQPQETKAQPTRVRPPSVDET